jgi:hypothetical protein
VFLLYLPKKEGRADGKEITCAIMSVFFPTKADRNYNLSLFGNVRKLGLEVFFVLRMERDGMGSRDGL